MNDEKEDDIKLCPECEKPLDEYGEGEVCCYYVGNTCETCKGGTCDHSC